MPDPKGNPTLLDLIEEIEDDIERADLNRQVRIAVDRAIRHYQPERFGFNERVLTFVTMPGVDVYAGGDLGEIADLYAVDTLVLIQNDQPWPLRRVPESDIETRQDAASLAQPCRFSFFDRSIRLDPVPDAAYTMRLTGHVKIAAPATDDATSPWVDEAGTLIAAWAKRHLAQNSLRNPAMAQIQDGAVRQAFNELRGRANRAASAGVIRAWSL
ncbi:hypothetical protein [Methylobacterium nonmethylotrophicum]|uniref:Uncharacterized protein n=1 Tax=Methylobacterium nonmethylotrophicum TaxID=1141884 RepID=A0A4Z0NFQ0_9HYPH|nr:hypothetical protein [Methylobacterium nonmethylotrophicum]TGD94061.1 hypothetical protein EU555_32590 [Methylobacterium nonmethylotrophicum]